MFHTLSLHESPSYGIITRQVVVPLIVPDIPKPGTGCHSLPLKPGFCIFLTCFSVGSAFLIKSSSIFPIVWRKVPFFFFMRKPFFSRGTFQQFRISMILFPSTLNNIHCFYQTQVFGMIYKISRCYKQSVDGYVSFRFLKECFQLFQ